MKISLCTIYVKGDVKKPIKQNLIVNLKWIAIAIIVSAVVIGFCVLLWTEKPFDTTEYWLTESSGRVHKEGCQYYKKSNGRIVKGKFGRLPCKKCFGLKNKQGEKNEK